MSSTSSTQQMLFFVADSPAAGDLQIRRAVVQEGLSKLTETRVEVLCRDRALDLGKLVGEMFNIVSNTEALPDRRFLGTCISAENVGVLNGHGRYIIEVRPRLWFLTRSVNCRVFQDKSTPEIVQSVLQEHGLGSDIVSRLSSTYDKRDFCLQYDETDFDFISRLMEEEGIYYYFLHKGQTEQLVLADGIGSHDAMPGGSSTYRGDESGALLSGVIGVFGVETVETTPSGKVSLADQDFEKNNPKLMATRSIVSGRHDHNKKEVYRHPGRFRDNNKGEKRAKVKMEALAATHRRFIFTGTMLELGVGMTVMVENQPRTVSVKDFLAVNATHYLMTTPETSDEAIEYIPVPQSLRGDHSCRVETMDKQVTFRAPLVTPWPAISSIQTALVVGPKGEEIYTDEYGRIRIQFFWDRLQAADEKASVWIRVAMPWAGSGWGFMAVPRIGQEVVVQFENGDPDRPIVTGMLYNANSMPPWALPNHMTQSGIKTNSSKDGGGFNELMMEDKKGSELVRFQSEKDYSQIVKNNATITVGLEKKDQGDMSLTVYRNLSEKLETGDHDFTVATGNQKIFVKTNKTETIEGESSTTVTKDVTHTVLTGNVTEEVKTGNYSLKTSTGKIHLDALQEILLTVGQNSIKIDQSGVTINGIMIKLDGQALIQTKAPMTQVNADALLILKGAMTMIN